VRTWDKPKAKYANEKITDEQGDKFDSKGEYQRWCDLLILQRLKLISNLERQVTFELQPAFKYNGKTMRAITWRPDFCYTEGDTDYVEDFKSPATAKTPDFRMKLKMFAYMHADTHKLRISQKKRGAMAVADV